MPRQPTHHSIAIIGTGIAGMSAAWLLSQRHQVTVFEQSDRLGGHSHTVDVAGTDRSIPTDTGFIVYNEVTYPNLTALFRLLDVPTVASDMSFAVSLRDGGLEYASTDLRGLFAQRGNLLRPRFWRMLRDLIRFYRDAPRALPGLDDLQTLSAFLRAHNYSDAFIEDHLLPMAAAIWSTPTAAVGDQPAAAFIRFCHNHGLLSLRDRPVWRTVAGGSRSYVRALTAPYAAQLRLGCAARQVRRLPDGVVVADSAGQLSRFDHVVIATHSDQALRLLHDPSDAEAALLGAIRYGANRAVLHSDPTLMPRRRAVWSSWNFLGGDAPMVTYWMNRLQHLHTPRPLLVTLNPIRSPDPRRVLMDQVYTHPLFDAAAVRAQRQLWSLQGVRRTWYCGAWFGAGFHEDGLQAGLAVAEQLGGVRRPWNVPDGSSRIHVTPPVHVALAA